LIGKVKKVDASQKTCLKHALVGKKPSRCPGKDIRKMKIISLCISLVFITNVLSAQIAQDTVLASYTSRVMEVVGSADLELPAMGSLDGNRQELYGIRIQHDLGTLLERSGVAFVNVSGPPGSSSTARFGGFGSDHSVILWNGVPLNALSLGTCDVSLIPAFFMDHAVLHKSPSLSEMPMSGLGMTMDLNSANDGIQPGYVRLSHGYNSLRNSTLAVEQYHQLVGSRMHSKNEDANNRWIRSIGWRTRAMIQDLKNEFSYNDTYIFDSPLVRQMHNNAKGQALLNDVSINTGTGVFSLHHWYGVRNAMLPALMGRYATGTAEQDDQLNRTVLKWSMDNDNMAVEISSAYFAEQLSYRDMPLEDDHWLIQSSVQSRSLLNRAMVNLNLGKKIIAGIHLSQADQLVLNSNYEHGRSRLTWMQAGGHITMKSSTWKLVLDAQQDSRILHQGPAISFASEYSKSFSNYSIRPYTKISRKFRAPDMNELFWVPGGNRDLLSESAVSVVGGMECSHQFNKHVILSVNPSAHRADVINWIQWVPGELGYWAPVNYNRVLSTGVEFPLKIMAALGKHNLLAESRVVYTNAQIKSLENNSFSRMIYTPQWTHAAVVGYSNEKLDISFRHRYMSSRFTDEQNSKLRELSAYHVFGLSMGYSLNGVLLGYSIGLDIDNVFNNRFESVRAFAIPGRVVSLNLTAIIKTNKKIDYNEK
jgi:iron complex outermembrane receptor protein